MQKREGNEHIRMAHEDGLDRHHYKKKEERIRGHSRSSSSPKERPLPQTKYNAYRSHLSLCTCIPYFIMILYRNSLTREGKMTFQIYP